MNDDAVSLTELLRDYGALWEISRRGPGLRAQRRRPPAPPVTFTAPSAAALRPLLEHGYDPAELAAISHAFGRDWHVERVEPGSGWLAVSRADAADAADAGSADAGSAGEGAAGEGAAGAPIRVIVAADLERLRAKLDRAGRLGAP
jgi:hypothetical protein